MLAQGQVQCPPRLLAAAQKLVPLRTGVVNAVSRPVMESARDAAQAGVIEPVLIGAEGRVRALADEIAWDISDFDLVDTDSEAEAAALAADAARRGAVGAVMKGHIHTDVYMRALLKREAELRTGRRLSHVFHMSVPDSDRALLISDAALNTHPDFDTKKAITANAVLLARAIGLERPRVALLSATEEANEAVPSSIEAGELAKWAAAGGVADADVFGPLAFDLAVSPDAAQLKGVDSPVAGRADLVVVPDIVSGNALFKMMVYFMGACAAGLVLGAKIPILLTSRADPPAARLASAALAAIAHDGIDWPDADGA